MGIDFDRVPSGMSFLNIRFLSVTIGRFGPLSRLLRRLLVSRWRAIRWRNAGTAGYARIAVEESPELRDTPADLSPPECLTSCGALRLLLLLLLFRQVLFVLFNVFVVGTVRRDLVQRRERVRSVKSQSISPGGRVLRSRTAVSFRLDGHFASPIVDASGVLFVATDRQFRRRRFVGGRGWRSQTGLRRQGSLRLDLAKLSPVSRRLNLLVSSFLVAQIFLVVVLDCGPFFPSGVFHCRAQIVSRKGERAVERSVAVLNRDDADIIAASLLARKRRRLSWAGSSASVQTG